MVIAVLALFACEGKIGSDASTHATAETGGASYAATTVVTTTGGSTSHATQRFYADPDGDGYGTDSDYIVADDHDMPPTGYIQWITGRDHDNCPNIYNPDQQDRDMDGQGDACDGAGTLYANISPDNPPGRAIFGGETGVPVLGFTLTANTQNVPLHCMQFEVRGSHTADVITKLTIVDEQDNVISTVEPDSGVGVYYWFEMDHTIPAASDRKFLVKADINPDAIVGQTFHIELVRGDLICDALGGYTLTGSFPQTGNTFAIANPQIADGDAGVPCGPFTITGEYGETYQVNSLLEFALNPNSPSGALSSGLQTVLTIDATVKCGTVDLRHVQFQTYYEIGGGMAWMWHLQDVETGVAYMQNGVATLHSYGPGSETQPTSTVTGMYWNHSCRVKNISTEPRFE
jgi:hypothetical protein